MKRKHKIVLVYLAIGVIYALWQRSIERKQGVWDVVPWLDFTQKMAVWPYDALTKDHGVQSTPEVQRMGLPGYGARNGDI